VIAILYYSTFDLAFLSYFHSLENWSCYYCCTSCN